jgi:hypothetical protein
LLELQNRGTDAKQIKRDSQGLTSYAMYGPKNKFNNSFSNEELANVTSNELIQKIRH